jgi:hypothetical protein
MSPVGYMDPDWEQGGQKRPAWAKPKTELAKEALAISGRQYFRGQTKHDSEFALWDAQEQMAIGATDDSYLHLMWIRHNMELGQKKRADLIPVSFQWLLRKICDHEAMVDWKAKNRSRVLDERGKAVLGQFNRAAELARDEGKATRAKEELGLQKACSKVYHAALYAKGDRYCGVCHQELEM